MFSFSLVADDEAAVQQLLFEVSPETTVVDGPISPRGTVDYIAYLNQRCSTGVTPENNAAVLLAEAFGPEVIISEVRESYFTQLGIAVPPDAGEYFTRLEESDDEFTLREDLQSAIERPWTADDYPELAEWIEANAAALDIIEEASRRSHYYSPLVCAEGNAVGSTILECEASFEFAVREAARTLCARATLRVAEEDHAAAWSDIACAMRLARLVDQESRILSTLGAIGTKLSALRSLKVLLNARDVSDLNFTLVATEFDALRLDPNYRAKFDESERLAILNTIQETAAQAGVNGRTDWNVALRTANGWFDDIVAMSEADGTRDIEVWAEELDERINRTQGEVFGTPWYSRLLEDREESGRFEGNAMVARLLPAVQQVARAAVRLEAREQLARIGIALAAYRADHDSYPEELSALAPEYLDEIPLDPFSDTQPVYRLESNEYTLYSLGPNFEDDGGHDYEDSEEDYDIVLRIQHAEARRPVRSPAPEP
jgi:hypothetical protein